MSVERLTPVIQQDAIKRINNVRQAIRGIAAETPPEDRSRDLFHRQRLQDFGTRLQKDPGFQAATDISENRHPFLRTIDAYTAALTDIANKQTPTPLHPKRALRRDMAIEYLFSGKSLKEIGMDYGVGPATTLHRIRREVLGTLSQASEAISQQYPFDSLDFNKPTIQQTQERFETQRGVGSVSVASAERKPAKVARGILANAALVTDPEQAQRVLDQVTRSIFEENRDRFTTVSQLLAEAGFALTSKENPIGNIAQALGTVGVPVKQNVQEVKSGKQQGVHPYYFTLNEFRDMAVDLLRNHEAFAAFPKKPVTLIFGSMQEGQKMPSSSAFKFKAGHAVSAFRILQEVAHAHGTYKNSGENGVTWFRRVVGDEPCPVPVFQNKDKRNELLAVFTADAEKFRAYVEDCIEKANRKRQ